jgi:DNA modification methylase
MQNKSKKMSTAKTFRKNFTISTPIFFSKKGDLLKLEMKPYLQPFERLLAMRELKALVEENREIIEENGYFAVQTNKPEEFYRERLTYWQRVGRNFLVPTDQKSLEFSQNGFEKAKEAKELHRARRLRYGPHNLHEYRGKFFPQLVRSLINMSGISDKAIVFDPMCGSGTTLCEALAMDISTVGSDLNPLSTLIANVKSKIVLERPASFQKNVLFYLNKFQLDDPSSVSTWSEEDISYLKRWFSPVAMKETSIILTNIMTVNKLLYRDLFRVCLSNIIRSVSWQKDADLRVRKEIGTYIKGTVINRFKEEVLRQLDRIYSYLCLLPRRKNKPSLLIRQGDAVNIDKLFPEYLGKVDLLITSPPYATALPYLDTDRLSLIVLGLLPRNKHSETEKMMVGTREITERQRKEEWEKYLSRKHELPDRVSKLIAQVAKKNHDGQVGFRRKNLPTLLGKYFLNMLDSMRSVHNLMKPGAYGYYVVGNNSTILDGEKTEIKTDEFLYEIGEAAGWEKVEKIPMELLASRDIFRENRGSAETILCFSAKNNFQRKAIYTTGGEDLLSKNGIEWNFHDANTREHLHSLHPYPAKFIPQIPRKAIEAYTAVGEAVYDPFCGCGTTNLEARLLGRPSFGTDNNPVAILVSKAKNSIYKPLDIKFLQNFSNNLEGMLAKTKTRTELIPQNKNFKYWFNEEMIERLAMLKGLILDTPEPSRTMLLAIFSSIIVRLSYQDSDTRYAKVERELNISNVGKIFNSKLLNIIHKLPEVMNVKRTSVTLKQIDSKNVPFIKSGSIKLIVTSPPYLNAYDYHKYHRQRIHWIDGDFKFSRDLEIGSHDEFTKPGSTPDQYFVDMEACFKEWHRVLTKNGKCLIVIGDAIVSKKPVSVADIFIELMKKQGISLEQRWIRELHLTKRAFNTKNARINKEHVLLFSKE